MGTDCKSAAFQLRWFESTRAHQTRKIRTYFRLEKGSDFSFSSGLRMKAPVDAIKQLKFREEVIILKQKERMESNGQLSGS